MKRLSYIALVLLVAVIAVLMDGGARSAAAQGGPAAPGTRPSVFTRTPSPIKLIPGEANKEKPTKAVDQASCVTAECHVNVKQFKVVHGPVNVNSCDACHKLVDEKTHTFEAKRAKADLCTFCHQVQTPEHKVLHKPVTDGECMGCHNPHGGETRRFLHGKTMNDLCSRCHEDVLANKKMIHGPAAAGTCDSCHTSHGSLYPKLLNAQGNELCYNCHDQMKTQLSQVKFVHKAATEKGCLECHDAHGSNFTMQIKKEPVELCMSCHDKVSNEVKNTKHKHSVVTKDQGCLTCHTSHGSDFAQLMKDTPVNACMKCHEKPQKDDKGKVIVAAVADIMEPDKVKHGPIRDGNCGGCHNVHGSDHDMLLAKTYNPEFYQKFSIDKYELCFSCHDKSLVEAPKAKGLTGFRNGEVNLHYAHVAKTEKGRNCRSCHETHASNHELHVREKVMYGKWEMPIKFEKSETGGSCSPGCHKPYQYDREKPVNYASPSAPTTQPVKAVANAGK